MLGVGAVFADLGMAGVPLAAREKTTLLTPAEVVMLQNHPRASVERMRALVVGDVALNAAGPHHEHWDGAATRRTGR